MTYYAGDNNRVIMFFESGTQGVTSGTGVWPGLVTNNDPGEATNMNHIRYAGGDSRNVDATFLGAQDFDGTLTYHPQDWRFMGYMLGSMVDAGAANKYTHHLSEVDSHNPNAFTLAPGSPHMSFTLVDSKLGESGTSEGTNSIKYLNGCIINTMTINMTDGEPISVDINYLAQSSVYASGIISGGAVSANTDRPFIFSDVQLFSPSGTQWPEITDMSFEMNNNLMARHYLNGSRTISAAIPQNRDYTLNITIDATDGRTKALYDQYFRGGSSFSALMQINASTATGSRDLTVALSGCKIDDMDDPTIAEGTNAQSLVIRPAAAYVIAVDNIAKYNPW